LAETYLREFETNALHNPTHLVIYVHTVPCKNQQRFLRHTVQHQINIMSPQIQYFYCHITWLSSDVNGNVKSWDGSYYQSKVFEVSPNSSHTGTAPYVPLIHCLVNDMLLQTRPCSNQSQLQISNVEHGRHCQRLLW